MATDSDSVLTNFVQSLDRDVVSIPESVSSKLSTALRQKLAHRGLLSCPAHLLDLPGRKLGDPEALAALLQEAIAHLFFGVGKNAGKQLAFLKLQIANGQDVDALVFLRLQQFVHDLHCRAYPQSAGIHKNVMKAAQILDTDPQCPGKVIVKTDSKPSSTSTFGIPGSTRSLVEQVYLERALQSSDVWYRALGKIRRFSRAATISTCEGMLELVHTDNEPFLLGSLERAIDELDFSPYENFPGQCVPVYENDGLEIREIVRTISDSDSYQSRHQRVDDFLVEARTCIHGMNYSEQVKAKMLEILECLAENARRCKADRIVGMEIAQSVGLPKQTLSDYIKRLKAALEGLVS